MELSHAPPPPPPPEHTPPGTHPNPAAIADEPTAAAAAVATAPTRPPAVAAAAPPTSRANMLADDAAILTSLLASLRVSFGAAQCLEAQVEGRQYNMLRSNSSPAEHGAWSLRPGQSSELPDDVAGGMTLQPFPPVPEVRPAIHYAAPMCVLVFSLPYSSPLQLRIGGRGLTDRRGALHFVAQVQGRAIRCTHRVIDVAPGDPLSLIDSWVQVQMPCLDWATSPGLLALECRLTGGVPGGASTTGATPSSNIGGGGGGSGGLVDEVACVVPIVLIDCPLIATEVVQLQREVLHCAKVGDVSGVAALFTFMTNLGSWLEWVDRGAVAVPAHLADPASVREVAKGLLRTAILRGWKHTAVRVSQGMARLGAGPQALPSFRGADSGTGATTSTAGSTRAGSSGAAQRHPQRIHATLAMVPESLAGRPSAAAVLSAATLGSAASAPASASASPRSQQHQRLSTAASPHATPAAGAGPSPLGAHSNRGGEAAPGCDAQADRRSAPTAVLRALWHGFQPAADEALYVSRLADVGAPLAGVWLLLLSIISAWSSRSVVLHGEVSNALPSACWIVPTGVCAWHFFAGPWDVYRTRREALWALCLAGRIGSRAALALGFTAVQPRHRSFLQTFGDVITSTVLPQSAEWVRGRYIVWLHLVDLLATAAAYRRVGLHDGGTLACLCHAAVQTLLGICINLAIECWTRRAFLSSVRSKQE